MVPPCLFAGEQLLNQHTPQKAAFKKLIIIKRIVPDAKHKMPDFKSHFSRK
jgi:hypothetical protein